MFIRFLLALAVLGPMSIAQTAPSTQRQRQPLIVPSGFKIVVVDRRRAVCQEGDEAWVRQALADAKPGQLPSTMPTQLLEKVSEQRDLLAERMAGDLGLPDPSAPRKMLDENLLPVLRQAAGFEPPIHYMVATEDTIKQLLKDGWRNPLFYLNRAADRVAIDPRVAMTLSEDADDILLPALYEPEHDMPTRRRVLLDAVARAESTLAYELTIQSETATQLAFVAFIGQNVFKPMEFNESQEWFAIGVTSLLSARYLAMVNGMDEDAFLKRMMTDDPQNPIRMATVNLLKPMTSEELRSSYQRAYIDAYRRRATAVVHSWLSRAPPSALGRTLEAIRTTKPADGAALVKLIADQTGIDLMPELKAE